MSMSFHLVAETYRKPFFVVGDTYRITVNTLSKTVHVGTLVDLPNVVNASSQGREVVYSALELEDLDNVPMDPYTGKPKICLMTLLINGREHYFVVGKNGHVCSIEKVLE
jgi:hypothetical protein